MCVYEKFDEMTEYQRRHEIRLLVEELNEHRHLYYNENMPKITDAEYDEKFDLLVALEKATGLILSNSPTQTVGAPVVSFLPKIQHPIPLLSLEKTKSFDDIIMFIGGRPALFMLKLDGLTVKLEYEDGLLARASTRGDGSEGEVITHNAKVFKNIPLSIPYKGRLVITGEAIIRDGDFQRLRDTVVGKDGKKYKNARNLAAGSARQLDAGESSKRCVRFVAFSVLEGLEGATVTDTKTAATVPVDTNSKSSMLRCLQELGFDTAFAHRLNMGEDGIYVKDPTALEFIATQMKAYAAEMGLPIDGLVASFDDVAYSKSLGRTGHHYRDGLAFKFEDETEETVLRAVEWNVTRSGELAPVAIFDTVELDGTEVSRASLHNLDFIYNLNLQIDDRILVSKRNMIIPHIEENLDKGKDRWASGSVYPERCPSCGGEVVARVDSLFCDNNACPDRKLRQLAHYVGKKAMDIDGLSEETLRKLMDAGLLTCEADIYELRCHRGKIVAMEGFGPRAFEKLIDAIEKSRNTTMERFIISMDIPELGRHVGAILCKAFDYNLDAIKAAAMGDFDFTTLEDFGEVLNRNIHDWFRLSAINRRKWDRHAALLYFQTPAAPRPEAVDSGNPFFGKTVVATGAFERFTRESINTAIESLGAKAGSSVSKKTDFVVAGDKAGSKKDKAVSLGVRVLTEAEFRTMAGL